MKRLILKRLLISVPLLLAISFTAFILRDIMESDSYEHFQDSQNLPASLRKSEILNRARAESKDLPLFYISIQPWSYPDTLYRYVIKSEKKRIKGLLNQGVPWPAVQNYLSDEQKMMEGLVDRLDKLNMEEMTSLYEIDALSSKLDALTDSTRAGTLWATLKSSLQKMKEGRNRFALFIPDLDWHGSNNRFHIWLKKIIRGDWGVSRSDYRPAWIKIREAVSWTLSISLVSLLLVYLISLFLGEWLFRRKEKQKGKITETFLFFLYSIPRFFLALLMILAFASDTVSPVLHIFPTPGFFDSDPEASLPEQWARYGSQLVLPVLCMVLPSLAYLTRIYSSRLRDEKCKPYAFMAWSKGDEEDFITRHHLRRNALMPLIALLGMEIPALFGGSIVIEVLFNIPGMGRLMLQSILIQDWVIVFNILLLTGAFTLLGKLLADLLYGLTDPRIRWRAS